MIGITNAVAASEDEKKEVTIQHMVSGNDYSKSDSISYSNNPSVTFTCNFPGVVDVSASASMTTGNPSPIGIVNILKNGTNIATSGPVTISSEKTLSAAATVSVDVGDNIVINASKTQSGREGQVKKLSGSIHWSVKEITYSLSETVDPNSMWR